MAVASDVFTDLRAAGVRVELRDGALRAGPADALTPELRALIRAHRDALARLLAGPHRGWIVTGRDGTTVRASFAPAASLAEVRAAHPNAASIEPDMTRPEPPATAPTAENVAAVREWLARIGETDHATIAETIERIRADANAFAYFMRRALEPTPNTQPTTPEAPK